MVLKAFGLRFNLSDTMTPLNSFGTFAGVPGVRVTRDKR